MSSYPPTALQPWSLTHKEKPAFGLNLVYLTRCTKVMAQQSLALPLLKGYLPTNQCQESYTVRSYYWKIVNDIQMQWLLLLYIRSQQG